MGELRFFFLSAPTGSRLVGIFAWDDGLQSPSDGVSHCFADSLEKMKRVAEKPLVFIGFCGLEPPRTEVNQGGSWVGFVEGNESFKMVVVASKNSCGVGRNQPWKMGGRERKNPGESSSFPLFFSDWLEAFSSFYVIGSLFSLLKG